MTVLGVGGAHAALDAAAARDGRRLGVDGPALLRERAEILAIAPAGTVSAGGTCRLLRARDGWIAMNLTRRDDVDLLAAWMEHEWTGSPWDAVQAALDTMAATDAVERAQLLGIPAAAAVAPEPSPLPPSQPADDSPAPRLDGSSVLDCSTLWAGPLCARLLGGLGADVVKAELRARPDGARAGPPEFWDSLNGGKEDRVVDGLSELRGLLDAADIVVTSARPRALDQLGLELDRRTREQGLVWVAITGYGLSSPWRDRVAFGDDAAVAGGLAVAAGGSEHPVFVGDAPADPLAGLHAAATTARALHARGSERSGAIIDVALSDVIAAAINAQYDARDLEVA